MVLVGKSVTELWNTDLDTFLQEWKVRKSRVLQCMSLTTCPAIMQEVGGKVVRSICWEVHETQTEEFEEIIGWSEE
jgi:hypothetical protein